MACARVAMDPAVLAGVDVEVAPGVKLVGLGVETEVVVAATVAFNGTV